jgi:hypothetical protein
MRTRKSDGTKYRNRLALAMILRHPRKIVIDRRRPKGGARNKQKEYLEDA